MQLVVLPPVEELQMGERRGEWIDYSTLDAQATGEVGLTLQGPLSRSVHVCSLWQTKKSLSLQCSAEYPLLRMVVDSGGHGACLPCQGSQALLMWRTEPVQLG